MPLSKFAKACAFAVAVVFSAGAAHAADKVYTLKLSHFVPPQHAFHKWVVKWTEKITKESNGRLKFQIYPNGQLVGPPNRQFDAARNGIVDIAWCLHGVTPGRYPMTELANLPFSWPVGRRQPAADGQAPDRACAEISRRRVPGPAHPVHEHGQPGRGLFEGADPLGRRLQGQEDPLRLDHQQGNARGHGRGADRWSRRRRRKTRSPRASWKAPPSRTRRGSPTISPRSCTTRSSRRRRRPRSRW